MLTTGLIRVADDEWASYTDVLVQSATHREPLYAVRVVRCYGHVKTRHLDLPGCLPGNSCTAQRFFHTCRHEQVALLVDELATIAADRAFVAHSPTGYRVCDEMLDARTTALRTLGYAVRGASL